MNITTYFTEFFTDLASPEWQWGLIAINLSVIFVLLFLFKFKIAWKTGVSTHDELSEKDNPAYGGVLASAFFSFFLIMGAASTGDDQTLLQQELMLMIGFGVSGMIMLFISRVFLDKIAMKDFCLSEAIRKQNIAAALVDSSNMIATALIIFTYMSWVQGTAFESILVVAYGWVISQVLLSVLSFIRAKMYKSKNGESLVEAISKNNIAVGIRYSAYKISFAFSAVIASGQYPYISEYVWWSTHSIFFSSILLSVIITLLTFLAKKIILGSIDFREEINEQNNTGLAAVEASLVLGITITAFCLLL